MKLTRLAAATGLLIAAGVGGVVVAGPASAYPAGTAASATINATVFSSGSTATVTVKNATPNGVLTEVFQSSPTVISSGAVVAANGSAVISGTIPAGAALGAHTITVTSTKGETFSFAVTLVSSGGSSGGSSSSGDLASTGAAVTGIGILGGVLVAGGVFFVVAGRRRAAADETPTV